MHRSATSLAARGISECGVEIGADDSTANEFNKWGYWENPEFVDLNHYILEAAGGSWFQPPPEEDILKAGKKFTKDIKKLIKKHESKKWGWKDPRTTLTIKLFHPHLKNPNYICCFRDPLEVAKSLQRRSKMDLEMGVDLANEYNKRLLDFLYGNFKS